MHKLNALVISRGESKKGLSVYKQRSTFSFSPLHFIELVGDTDSHITTDLGRVYIYLRLTHR